jgi:hypothetical protein
MVDKAGQVKTGSGRNRLVFKVDGGRVGQIKTSKNRALVPLLGTMFSA